MIVRNFMSSWSAGTGTRTTDTPCAASAFVLWWATVNPSSANRCCNSSAWGVSTSTIVPSAKNSAIEYSPIMVPLPITTNRSAVCSISASKCDDTTIAFPCSARVRIVRRIQLTPSGSSPLMGSSKIRCCGSPNKAVATPMRCFMPNE